MRQEANEEGEISGEGKRSREEKGRREREGKWKVIGTKRRGKEREEKDMETKRILFFFFQLQLRENKRMSSVICC